MEDIAGLNWSSTPASGQNLKPAPATSNLSAFSTLKPTPPASGRASPFNPASSQPPSKPSTPANDSFANLVSFGPASHKNLSLLEQQKIQVEAKLQQQKAQTQRLNDQYAGGDDQFWNNLGSGRGTPAIDNAENQTANKKNNELDDTDDDLFAAFNKPPAAKNDIVNPSVQKNAVNDDDHDDLFGLSKFSPRRADTAATVSTAADDDDVLGLLGKPVSVAKPESPSSATEKKAMDLHPQDKAVAELVDMGFPADKAKVALEATESGLDVQAAVGYLLNQAHADARQKARLKTASGQRGGPDNDGKSARAEAHISKTRLPWEDGEGSRSRAKGSTHAGEKDFEQLAAEFGSNFLKTANSLWKQGTKRVQQAVQEFNSDNEAGGQPRWMREVAERPTRKERPQQQHEVEPGRGRRRASPEARGQTNMTDEAMMLESNRPTPPPRPSPSSKPVRHFDSSADNSRDQSPIIHSRLRESLPQTQPAFVRQQNQSPAANSRAALNRAAAEEQAAQAYVSSARRRKPQPHPPHQAPSAAVSPGDLLEGGFKDTPPAPSHPTAKIPPGINKASPRPQSQPVKQGVEATPIQVRPRAPPRAIPSISVISLQASHSHREKGNEHFKRGDYASAHQSYATSLSHLPDTHPLTIVVLTNRALTALKIGEPKQAIVDADKAIMIIGPSKGENEIIEIASSGDMGNKPMREYYGKALMRKAEALEQMEKWSEAAVVWREAVEGGHGGTTSIQGRMRAEKAANPQKPKPAPASGLTNAAAKKSSSASAPPSSSLRRPPSAPATTSLKPAEAVSRLRAANLAADKLDDERFRLSESVDARINAWKSGKQDNLRALLGSLDSVLWEGSGWKKISMADLVLPGKVKVQYMKGIGKVHPDKIPTDATTEQRMIAGAVFSALNDAWDKFKAENGL